MSRKVEVYLFLIFNSFLSIIYSTSGSLQSDIELQLGKGNHTNLSRARRYLVFPEGSSFQLVYDLAYPTLDGIGFFVYGHTAALAWELPSTPIFLDKKFKKKEEPEPTTTMLPHLEHPDEYEHDWQPPETWNDPDKMDYQHFPDWKRKTGIISNYQNTAYNSKFGHIDRSPVSFYYNPFDKYNKRQFSYSNNRFPVQFTSPTKKLMSFRDYWSRNNAQRIHLAYHPVQSDYYNNELHHKIHRVTRRETYSKLEQLFAKFITGGRSCIFKLICQVNKWPKEKGTLWEELLKTIFKVKLYDTFDEDHYDQAANQQQNCDEMYPDCDGDIFGKLLSAVYKTKKINGKI
ncbi:hypothetical protein ABEB36_005506 [Hypothenemus hampei]|uniref:Uncharacterized protein n=1 Tax=Hypothenemus hampei TaxID=57062 RepID=A0ABD1F134_HYPHA